MIKFGEYNKIGTRHLNEMCGMVGLYSHKEFQTKA